MNIWEKILYKGQSKFNGEVKVTEKPWTFKDDNDLEAVSLLAAPVVVQMLKQMVEVLDL